MQQDKYTHWSSHPDLGNCLLMLQQKWEFVTSPALNLPATLHLVWNHSFSIFYYLYFCTVTSVFWRNILFHASHIKYESYTNHLFSCVELPREFYPVPGFPEVNLSQKYPYTTQYVSSPCSNSSFIKEDATAFRMRKWAEATPSKVHEFTEALLQSIHAYSLYHRMSHITLQNLITNYPSEVCNNCCSLCLSVIILQLL